MQWGRSRLLDHLWQELPTSLIAGLELARASLIPRLAIASASQSPPSQLNRHGSVALQHVHAIRREVTRLGLVAVGPLNLDALGRGRRAQAEGGLGGTGTQVAPCGGDAPPLVLAVRPYPNGGAEGRRVAGLAREADMQPMVAGLLVVAQQHGRSPGRREHQVEVAVAVDVRRGAAASHDRLEEVGAGGFGADGLEPRVAGVPEQLGGLTVPLPMLDLGDLLLEVAVDREQVETPVEVVVEEQDADLERVAAGPTHAP